MRNRKPPDRPAPVAEIELGASEHLRVNPSAGGLCLRRCWHDCGDRRRRGLGLGAVGSAEDEAAEHQGQDGADTDDRGGGEGKRATCALHAGQTPCVTVRLLRPQTAAGAATGRQRLHHPKPRPDYAVLVDTSLTQRLIFAWEPLMVCQQCAASLASPINHCLNAPAGLKGVRKSPASVTTSPAAGSGLRRSGAILSA
ncbi:MAG: hypothetical protein HC828_04275 [Blastochloris sp.]|nr:hypothetical protein [Blastochloris sp.]